MRNPRLTTLLLAGSLGLGCAVTGLVVAPVAAATAAAETNEAKGLPERVSRITAALSGLVSDGTLTQQQADRVASTLAERLPDRRHGDHGRGSRGLGPLLDTAAGTLGVTVDELRTALRGGQSLADVAAAEGVDRQLLVDALVAAAGERVDERLANGDITQEQADARKAELAGKVTELVDREGLPSGGGRGPRTPAGSSGS